MPLTLLLSLRKKPHLSFKALPMRKGQQVLFVEVINGYRYGQPSPKEVVSMVQYSSAQTGAKYSFGLLLAVFSVLVASLFG